MKRDKIPLPPATPEQLKSEKDANNCYKAILREKDPIRKKELNEKYKKKKPKGSVHTYHQLYQFYVRRPKSLYLKGSENQPKTRKIEELPPATPEQLKFERDANTFNKNIPRKKNLIEKEKLKKIYKNEKPQGSEDTHHQNYLYYKKRHRIDKKSGKKTDQSRGTAPQANATESVYEKHTKKKRKRTAMPSEKKNKATAAASQSGITGLRKKKKPIVSTKNLDILANAAVSRIVSTKNLDILANAAVSRIPHEEQRNNTDLNRFTHPIAQVSAGTENPRNNKSSQEKSPKRPKNNNSRRVHNT